MKHLMKITGDGSSTIYVPELDEHYHSTHGAVQESEHVFINAGLKYIEKREINLFEVGFGTGLNALLTYYGAEKLKIKVNYFSIEKYPLPPDEYNSLNYQEFLHDKQSIIKSIHLAEWGTLCEISPQFHLMKIEADALLFNLEGLPNFDLIYFDAFGPDKQPEMWQADLFSKLYQHCNPKAALVTYSAKGETRRRLQAAGFTTERLPGPPGKREMLRAIKEPVKSPSF
jgi:tRNA U34 5-methylaminomethyl-2-thiouridine-forming methyltransferase MnmC